MLSGNVFHNSGAIAEKHLSPQDTNFVLGIFNMWPLPDRSVRDGTYGTSKSLIYPGPVPCNALKVKSKILYFILQQTGNQ